MEDTVMLEYDSRQDDLEIEYLSHDVSESMYAFYYTCRQKFHQSLMLWCSDSIQSVDNDDLMPENEANTTAQLCSSHHRFQKRLQMYIEALQHDPSAMQIEAARQWTDDICLETLDGEIMHSLIPICTSLWEHPAHKQLIFEQDPTVVSSAVLRDMFVECMHRHAEVTFGTLQNMNIPSEDVPRLSLNRDMVTFEENGCEICVRFLEMIETEDQSCLAVLKERQVPIFVGSILAIEVGKKRVVHVRVTNLEFLPQITNVSDAVLRRHGYLGVGSVGHARLVQFLSKLYQTDVLETTPIHIIHFTPCASNANVYERLESVPQSVSDYLDYFVSQQAHDNPCVQQERVASLIKITDEIQRAYVSTAEKQDLMNQYHAKVGKKLRLISCASCGVRGLECDAEHGFAQITFPQGFPYEDDLYKEGGGGYCPCSYVPYAIDNTARPRRVHVKPHEAGAMYQRLRMDVDKVVLNAADRQHRYFQSLSQDHTLDQPTLNQVRHERKKIRDSLDRPPWHLSPENLKRYRLEQCIRSRFWDDKTASYYALHPELVEIDLPSSAISMDCCSKCRHHLVQPEGKDMPVDWYSLCNKIDFGVSERVNQLPPPNDGLSVTDVRENLPPLSLIEQMIVAKVRILCPVFKYTVKVWLGKSMRVGGHVGKGHKTMVLQGQCVAMENIHMDVRVEAQNERAASGDEAPEPEEIEWKMLSATDISNRVNVYFMVEGPHGEKKKDQLAALMLNGEHLKVNRKYLLRHLWFHHRNTPGYQDTTQFETIEREESFATFQQAFREHVTANMHVEDDASIQAAEQILTSDITGGHAGPTGLGLDGDTQMVESREDTCESQNTAGEDVILNGTQPPPPVGRWSEKDSDVNSDLAQKVAQMAGNYCEMPSMVAAPVNLSPSGSRTSSDSDQEIVLRPRHRIHRDRIGLDPKDIKKGGVYWYRDGGDGVYKQVEVQSIDQTLQPPSFGIRIDGRERETEAHRLFLHPPGALEENINVQLHTDSNDELEPRRHRRLVSVENDISAANNNADARMCDDDAEKVPDENADAPISENEAEKVPEELYFFNTNVQLTNKNNNTGKRAQHLTAVENFFKDNGKLDVPDIPGDGEPISEEDNSHASNSHASNTSDDDDTPQTRVTSIGLGDDSQATLPAQSSMRAAEIIATRSNELMHTKYEFDKIMCGGFPYEFPLGTGLEKFKDGLPVSLQKHLVSQFTTAFASNAHLLFYVFNRHIVSLNNNSAHVVLKDRPETTEWFGRYITDAQFLQKARNAARNPHSTEAEEVLRVVNPFLKITGEKMPFSDAEKQQFETETYAMFHRFGEPSYLVTVSPNNDVLSFRFSLPTRARGMFPASASVQPSTGAAAACDVGDLFEKEETAQIPIRGLQATDENAEIRMDIPVAQRSEAFNFSTVNLIKFATEHPVGCVEMFRRMLQAVLEILIGLPTTFSTSRKSILQGQDRALRDPKFRNKGILGYAKAAAGCTENSGRDATHSHFSVWTDLSPMIIQAAAANKPVMELIARVIESHMFAHIPPEYHIRDCLTKMVVYEKRFVLPRFGARDASDIGRAQSASPAFSHELCQMCCRCQVSVSYDPAT